MHISFSEYAKKKSFSKWGTQLRRKIKGVRIKKDLVERRESHKETENAISELKLHWKS